MLNRFSYVFLLALIAIVAFLFVYFTGDNSDEARYVGVERCRVCHEAASLGAQFKIWASGPHATAYSVLESDSAKAYLASHNVTTASCIGCHSTLGRPAENEPEQLLNAEGVGCERCHGPGSMYSDYNTMLDREAFTAHAGVVGSLQDCSQCHAANPATAEIHCPFQHEPFNADSAWQKIRHQVPQAADRDARPDTVLQLRGK